MFRSEPHFSLCCLHYFMFALFLLCTLGSLRYRTNSFCSVWCDRDTIRCYGNFHTDWAARTVNLVANTVWLPNQIYNVSFTRSFGRLDKAQVHFGSLLHYWSPISLILLVLSSLFFVNCKLATPCRAGNYKWRLYERSDCGEHFNNFALWSSCRRSHYWLPNGVPNAFVLQPPDYDRAADNGVHGKNYQQTNYCFNDQIWVDNLGFYTLSVTSRVTFWLIFLFKFS